MNPGNTGAGLLRAGQYKKWGVAHLPESSVSPALYFSKRNIQLPDRRTSIRLENYLWDQIDAILAMEQVPLPLVVSEIDQRRLPGQTQAQALRLFLPMFFDGLKTVMADPHDLQMMNPHISETSPRQPNFLMYVLSTFATNFLHGAKLPPRR